jgi:glutathione S-transferase
VSVSMELYHNDMSVCAQKVRLVLREKGLTPVEHHLNLRTGDQFKPDYAKLNPNGVVPTLVVDGRPIIESTLICEFLDEAYPQSPLRPEDLITRAEMRRWAWLPDMGLHAACGAVSFGIAFREQLLKLSKEEIEANIEETPDPARKERKRQTVELGADAPVVKSAAKTYDAALARMEDALSDNRPWLTGDSYTLADVAMTPYVVRVDQLKLTPFFDGRTRLSAWLERVQERPNYSAIRDYLNPSYLTLMAETGPKARDKIAAAIRG